MRKKERKECGRKARIIYRMTERGGGRRTSRSRTRESGQRVDGEERTGVDGVDQSPLVAQQ